MTENIDEGMSNNMRILVMMPTYNESMTLPTTVANTLEHNPNVDILVVDDASPDGTGELADQLAQGDGRIKVLHRAGKEGLGPAYVAAMRWGLEHGYSVLVEMDADGSHRAEDLPHLIAALDSYPDAAVVLGSRWVSGGATVNWPASRRFLSRGGNLYVRTVLGLPVMDATGGFRAYRARSLQSIDLDAVASHGYCFQVDMVWRIYRMGLQIVEVPIVFVERAAGNSKMSSAIVRESLIRVTMWGVKYRFSQLRQLLQPTRKSASTS